MAKYKTKVVEKEVSGQFFAGKKPWPKGVHTHVYASGDTYAVITIHGQETIVIDGDWIIEEPDGIHYYPCKPDIFEATYEKVEDNGD